MGANVQRHTARFGTPGFVHNKTGKAGHADTTPLTLTQRRQARFQAKRAAAGRNGVTVKAILKAIGGPKRYRG